jgi:hypothetical protein
MMKQALRTLSPPLYQFLRERYRKNTPYNRLARRIGRRLNWTVSAGPFVGMKYLPSACCERILPKILGSYEQELWPALGRLASLPVRTVINVGCAEGYYAVGLARLFPAATVYAFDLLSAARQATLRAADANGVGGRIRISGGCSAATLAGLPIEGALIAIDCEGAEFEILDPAIAPGLAASHLLVELHDMIDPRITPELLARFSATHEIEIVDAAERDAASFPVLAGLSAADQTTALDEGREWGGVPTHQQWAIFQPKRNGQEMPR